MVRTYMFQDENEVCETPVEDIKAIMDVCDQFIEEGRVMQIVDHLCCRPDILAPSSTIRAIVEDYLNEDLRRDML